MSKKFKVYVNESTYAKYEVIADDIDSAKEKIYQQKYVSRTTDKDDLVIEEICGYDELE